MNDFIFINAVIVLSVFIAGIWLGTMNERARCDAEKIMDERINTRDTGKGWLVWLLIVTSSLLVTAFMFK